MLVRPERFFADRFGLSASVTERLLGGTLARRVDHADLYLEYRVTEELVLEEGAVKKASRHVSQGAGVRAQSGERTGYAHTDDLALPNLEEAVRQARAIADGAGESAVVPVVTGRAPTTSTRSPSRRSPPMCTPRWRSSAASMPPRAPPIPA